MEEQFCKAISGLTLDMTDGTILEMSPEQLCTKNCNKICVRKCLLAILHTHGLNVYCSYVKQIGSIRVRTPAIYKMEWTSESVP